MKCPPLLSRPCRAGYCVWSVQELQHQWGQRTQYCLHHRPWAWPCVCTPNTFHRSRTLCVINCIKLITFSCFMILQALCVNNTVHKVSPKSQHNINKIINKKNIIYSLLILLFYLLLIQIIGKHECIWVKKCIVYTLFLWGCVVKLRFVCCISNGGVKKWPRESQGWA